MKRAIFCLGLVAALGCGYNGFEDVHRVPEGEMARLVRKGSFPDRTPAVEAEAPAAETLPDGRRKVRLDLKESLRLALKNNLGTLTEGEALDVDLLTLEVLRRSWWPMVDPVTGIVSYSSSPEDTHTLTQSVTAGLSQKTPTGGTLAATWVHSGSQPVGADAYAGTGILSYTQPILRGAGRRAAVEELVSAERRHEYSRRRYDYNRLSLQVGVVESYFGLLQQDAVIRNSEINLDRSRALADRAVILEQAGRVTRADVFRSQLQVTRAEADVVRAQEQIKIARDAFKIDLGIDPEAEIELVPEKIEYRPLRISREEAVALALENNPDYLIARDAADDARRALALAENANLAKFDATVAYRWTSENADRLLDSYPLESRAFSVTGSFEIPLDRFSLRRDYQKALISCRQAERAFLRARDTLMRNVQSGLILVRQAELSLGFEERALVDAQKTLERAQLDYENGRATNRDVIDAQVQLLDSQNACQQKLVTVKVSQLRLLQFIGRLATDPEGEWLK
jgi:outer membrane protein TolC